MVFLGEEKDPLYQGMVELGVPDETKATHLGFLYYLGLLNIGPDLFVKLNSIPQHTRSIDFGKQYPLVLRIISAHDNLLAFRRRRHTLNEAISNAALRTRRNVYLYKSCDAMTTLSMSFWPGPLSFLLEWDNHFMYGMSQKSFVPSKTHLRPYSRTNSMRPGVVWAQTNSVFRSTHWTNGV